MKRKYWIAALAALILIGGIVVFVITRNTVTEVKIETETIGEGSISEVVTATGTLEPVQQVEVGTQVSGTIERIYVDYNSVVKKGQLLALLDRTVLASTLQSVRTDSASNKAELDYQDKNFKRIKALYEQNAVSDAEYEQAEYSYKRAYYTYQKSLAQVVTAKQNLSYCYIYSPIDGVVLSKSVDEGQTVASSFNTPTLFTIAQDLSKMEVLANVDEADIGGVKEGQRVTFTVDAYPGETFDGIVTQVRLEATTTSNVVTYSVEIAAPNPDLKLKPGLTANIMIYVKEIKDIPLISNMALSFTAENDPREEGKLSDNGLSVTLKEDQRVVYVVNGHGKDATPRVITVGESDGANYQIVEGLSVGEKVVTGVELVTQKATSSSSSPFAPKRPNRKSRGSNASSGSRK